MKLFIYGTIGVEVKASEIISQIEGTTDDEIQVFINSPGGSVYEGFAIYNTLQRHQAKVSTFIDGLAYSAASWIALAATKDKRFMSNVSQFGIHEALNMGGGNKVELKDQIEQLAKIDAAQEFIYTSSTGLNKTLIRDIMKAGKPLSLKEAGAFGFQSFQPQKIAAYFNLNNDMSIITDFEKFLKGAKGEEVAPEIEKEVAKKLSDDLAKAETPAEVLSKDFAKSKDFEEYKASVEPMLQSMFDYIKGQPTMDQINSMIEKAANAKMIQLVSQIKSSEEIPTGEETGFDRKEADIQSFEPLSMNKNFFQLKNELK